MIIHCNVKAGFYRTVDSYEPASSRTLGIMPKIRDSSTAICAGKDSESQGWTTTNVFGSNACRQGGQIRCTPHLSTSKHRLQNSAWQRKSARTSAITAIRSGIRPSVDGEDKKKQRCSIEQCLPFQLLGEIPNCAAMSQKARIPSSTPS